MNYFIEHLDIPKLTDEERDRIEGPITLQECKLVLDTFQANKSPGEDGFTVEFYKYFVGLLGADLVASFNAASDANELSISQRRGVITLIPKARWIIVRIIQLAPNYITKCGLELYSTENFIIQLNESTQLVLNKAKTSDFYKLLNVKTHTAEHTGPRRWNENLSMHMNEDSWRKAFTTLKNLCRETKSRAFQSKLINRIIVTIKRAMPFWYQTR